MSVAEFRGGWSPTPSARPRVRLTSSLRADVAPPQTNFGAGVPVIGWHLNDQWGCCTCAADANLVQQQTFFGQGSEASVADAEVLKAYEVVGNFDPNAGQPGQNPTDQGALIPDALGYLKNTGMMASDGVMHKIAAYGQIDVTQLAKLKTAIWEFGCLSVGINLPNSAIQQFNAGQDWDVAASDGGIAGGHCVLVVGYDSIGYLLFTWDKLIHMTYAFAAKYMEEAWAPVSQDWVNRSTGKDPEGVDLATLGQEFQAVTGSNPFPKPPGPAPVPPPGPAPTPTPTPSGNGCLPLGRVLGRLRRGHH